MIQLFEQTLTLFIFISVGFGLARAKIIHGEHAKILSELFVYIFLPCNCLMVFSKNFTVAYITEKYTLILVSSVFIITIAVIMHFVAKIFSKEKYERVIYEYSLVLSNCAGVGYPIALNLLGMEALTDLMVFIIPINIYTYTYGYSNLMKRSIAPKDIFSSRIFLMLLNPVTISMFVGMIIGLLGITLPGFVMSAVSGAASCLSPVALLIVGIAIAGFDLKSLLKDVRSYIAVALRLIVQPILFGGIMWLIGIRGPALISAVIFLAGPCGMNTVTVPKMLEENCKIGASMALLSNVFACVTIPLVLAFFGIGV